MFLEAFESLNWRSIADITLVALLFYQIISMLKGTRAAQVVVGLLVIFFAYLISSLLQFETLNWIISKFYSSFILVVIVLFQDDIRRLLTRFGRGPFVSGIDEGHGADVIDNVLKAASSLSHDRLGALVVFERGVGLDKLYDRSVPLDAKVTEQLMLAIFHTFSPLHDGAVIIQKNRVACASAHLPLSKSSTLSRKLGTRHSAALGISEETDAVVLVVSEETGSISLAHAGRLELQSSPMHARENLTRLLMPLGERTNRRPRWRAFEDRNAPAGIVAEAPGDNVEARSEYKSANKAGSIFDGGTGAAEDPLAMARGESEVKVEVAHQSEGPSESMVLQDVRRITKLSSTDKYKPPVLPVQPPRDVARTPQPDVEDAEGTSKSNPAAAKPPTSSDSSGGDA